MSDIGGNAVQVSACQNLITQKLTSKNEKFLVQLLGTVYFHPQPSVQSSRLHSGLGRERRGTLEKAFNHLIRVSLLIFVPVQLFPCHIAIEKMDEARGHPIVLRSLTCMLD